jgi:hypothetical protein
MVPGRGEWCLDSFDLLVVVFVAKYTRWWSGGAGRTRDTSGRVAPVMTEDRSFVVVAAQERSGMRRLGREDRGWSGFAAAGPRSGALTA